ncbi:hypothetical protein [uncultured Desulfobacter sp.]|uniref:pilus assembly protein n=1 Tax=uncultured Desulfobacter sp. TaxID=240139 RepID=UPI0029C673F5|nr:hypothetical protein [uncultured Desulfobacter sp.]
MKTKLLFILGLIAWASFAFAEDVDIYGVSNIQVKPNVLIILDNSGSMDTEDVSGAPYDPATTYSGSYSANKVYRREWNRWRQRYEWNEYFGNINSSNWKCDSAKNGLLSKGYWEGKLYKSGSYAYCSSSYYTSSSTFSLGNYINYENTGGANRTRMEVAKEVVADLIHKNHENVRFGLMSFNYDQGGYIVAGCGATKTTLIGDYDPDTDKMTDSVQSNYGAVGKLESKTWTPLAETMAEAGLYFAGKKSWFNTGTYTSPIQNRCQKNYIILVTDGAPTKDDDKFAYNNYILNRKLSDDHNDTYNSSGYSYDANESHYSFLDDVAYFLQNNDLSYKGSTGDFENQNVTVYTIGFKQELPLLYKTAERGGGEYYQALNASALGRSLNTIIAAIEEQNEVFTAAAVPVSRANRAYAGNYVYYGLFQPTNAGNWYGNLKKYAITDDGVIQDTNGNAIESGGTIVNNAVSFWSSAADGSTVTAGGAGEVLKDRTTDRNIYTYTGTQLALTDQSNLFTTTNTALIDGTYTGLTTTVIDDVRKGVTADWPLASLLHSQPLVVHYDTNNDGTEDRSMIYVGANDGMLHCFDDNNGEEMWGFIPQDLLDELSRLTSPSSLEYFVDGTPVYYHYDHDTNANTADKKLLIFGERRGGNHYTVLDISDYSAPIFKYSISPDILGSGKEQLGQSWADPQALEMAVTASSTKDVFLMAGGYDTNQDKLTSPAPDATDTRGRIVYAVDAQSGVLFSNFLFSSDNYTAMTHSIIAVSGFENPKTTTTTRVYAGDMNGNLFAFRDDIFHRNTDSNLAGNFSGLYDGQEDGVWGQKLKLYAVPGRKIWNAPNIVNEYLPVDFTYPAGEISGVTGDVVISEKRVGDYVFFGTGDRAHPERKDLLNGFYAIKNNWQWSGESPTIVEADIDINNGKVKDKNGNTIVDWNEETVDTGLYILDVTDNLIQNNVTDTDVSQKITNYVKNAINHKNNRGWFIRIQETNGSKVGEKVVSSPLIFNGVVYFSTYVPDTGVAIVTDPCAISGAGGNGYLYAIGYKYGEAVINFDPTNDTVDENNDKKEVLRRSDRRKKLKNKGIPPQPVLVVHEGKPTIITGFETIDPLAPTGLERAFWRQLNK